MVATVKVRAEKSCILGMLKGCLVEFEYSEFDGKTDDVMAWMCIR